MTVKDRLIELFENNRGNYLSGEDIAKELNVTRTAVWKAVKDLQAERYKIQAVTNKGYCLSDEGDVISSAGISKYLTGNTENIKIEAYKSVDSTNTLMRKKASDGEAEGCVAVAASQTGGKGRYGRNFFSPSDTGIYLSILLRPNILAEQATLITTAAAVSVCEAIENISDTKPLIKWVNDVFVNGKKVCGILTEASFGMECGKLEYAVVGVGINVYSPLEGFPNEIKDIAGAIFDTRQNDSRNRLAAAFLNNFMRHYAILEQKDFIDAYKSRSFIIGKKVTVIFQNKTKSALALDIDDNCHLSVRYDDGTEDILSSGEVSIKMGVVK